MNANSRVNMPLLRLGSAAVGAADMYCVVLATPHIDIELHGLPSNQSPNSGVGNAILQNQTT